jgi:hypothetical protein
MLKLEREQQTSTFTLKFRERETMFHPLFLQALAIALAFHLSFFIFFHIAPFSLISSFTFPPVAVESPASTNQTLVVSTARWETDHDRLSPPLSTLPPLDWIDIPSSDILFSHVNYDIDRMRHLEAPDWPLLHEPLPVQLEEPRIHLTISGDLAQRPLLSHDPLLDERSPLTNNKPPLYAYIDYRVQIDEHTGKIFWTEQLRSSGIAHVDKSIERLINRLEFETDDTLEATIGNLHFAIKLEATDD